MTLTEYLATGAISVTGLAKAIGVKDPAQVRAWRYGYANRKPSPVNCTAIEAATGGAVTRQELRPDDWRAIWPELADNAPSIST